MTGQAHVVNQLVVILEEVKHREHDAGVDKRNRARERRKNLPFSMFSLFSQIRVHREKVVLILEGKVIYRRSYASEFPQPVAEKYFRLVEDLGVLVRIQQVAEHENDHLREDQERYENRQKSHLIQLLDQAERKYQNRYRKLHYDVVVKWIISFRIVIDYQV